MQKSSKIKVLLVAGARPNFMKIAPLLREFRKQKKHFQVKLIHTGQHYDFQMSEVFFDHLKIPKPDIFLNVGSSSHAAQTATIMVEFEKVLLSEKPNLVVVVGDVNSTIACSLVAAKLDIKVAHVEAGLRSFDRRMPEEINRLVTDAISDYMFVSERSGLVNLKKEGVPSKKVFFVGNVMIDTLLAHMPDINKSGIQKKLGIVDGKYCAMTLHRPSNVDSKKSLLEVYAILNSIPSEIKIIYPIHPRTKKMVEKHGLLSKFGQLKNIMMIDPLGYVDFIRLIKGARFVLTDSGGIQEETTVLIVPCITMRENTERPMTVKVGTNVLVGRNKGMIVTMIRKVMAGKWKKGVIPELWDGKTANRIVKIIRESI
jgi:UDP-N-acetylglucosamine 2-epimerase (non-hydrolysing)